MIEQGGGAGQPSRFKEGEAADGFGGIELAAHQALQGLAGMLQLVVDHFDHLLKAPPQQGINEISLGFCKPIESVALGCGSTNQIQWLRLRPVRSSARARS